MIFATVGTQLPFDRLIQTIDEWANSRREHDVFAQIGHSSYVPEHVRWAESLRASQFRKHLESATAIVSHAGIGTILSALELGKPIIVFPRRAALREHRNDHQLATAERFEAMGLVSVAWDESELLAKLDDASALGSASRLRTSASPELLENLRQFIAGHPCP